MKKKILSATFVVAMMAVAGYNVYMNQAKAGMSELALANVEALADDGEGVPQGFYTILKFRIAQMLEVTSVSGEISAAVDVGMIFTSGRLAELKGQFKGEIEAETVDCHKGECLSTTEKQNIQCIADDDWMKCHTQCNHSNNQI